MVEQAHLVARQHHKPFSHVTWGLIVGSQSRVLWTLREHNLQVLCFRLDEVHEVVKGGGGGLGAVREVRLLDGDQQGGRQQPVAEDELARGDVHLDHRDQVSPVCAQACSSSLVLLLLHLLLIVLAGQETWFQAKLFLQVPIDVGPVVSVQLKAIELD